MNREAGDFLRRLETHVIIPVRGLRLAAWVHHIELRSDLISRPKPGLGNERNDFIAIIPRE